MNNELKGRLITLNPTRKFSKLGIFDSTENPKYICLEKVSTPEEEVKVYLIRSPSNEEFVNREVDHGDIVKLKGSYKTINGEVIFVAEKGNVLSKCEDGRRSPIFDLSSKVKETTILRSNILKLTRSYFSDKGFVEVTSPILLPFYEGGDADPFVTLDKDKRKLFLKETNELILRRLISCGLGPVYEIGRSFRNIGTNRSSLSEFSVVESAIPYASLSEGIDFAEGLLKHILKGINFDKIELANKWKRLNFEEVYKGITGQSYLLKQDYDVDRQDLSNVLNAIKGSPTFLIGLPYEISPINSRGKLTLDESVLVIEGEVYCDVCDFEVSKQNLKERLSQQKTRTNRDNPQFLKFADYGLVPGVGIAFGLERWMKQVSGTDITEIRNLGGVI